MVDGYAKRSGNCVRVTAVARMPVVRDLTVNVALNGSTSVLLIAQDSQQRVTDYVFGTHETWLCVGRQVDQHRVWQTGGGLTSETHSRYPKAAQPLAPQTVPITQRLATAAPLLQLKQSQPDLGHKWRCQVQVIAKSNQIPWSRGEAKNRREGMFPYHAAVRGVVYARKDGLQSSPPFPLLICVVPVTPR